MAKTAVADIIIPTEFERYAIVQAMLSKVGDYIGGRSGSAKLVRA